MSRPGLSFVRRITKTSTIAVIVSVRSPEGEQQYELDVGESVTVTGITKPIEVVAVSQQR